MNKIDEYIIEHWQDTIKKSGGKGLSLPYPVTVPCISENFTVFFYWDTYFTNLGLLQDNLQQARYNVENMRFFVEKMGFIPNGNLPVMFNRSQPPLYPHAVWDLYEKTGDTSLIERHYPAILTEYAFWMQNRMTPIGLNAYGASPSQEEVLDFYNELKSRKQFPDLQKDPSVILHYFAEAESGWDFSPRFEGKAMDYAQVELNGILYRTEFILSQCAKLLNKAEEEKRFLSAMQNRKKLMQRYFMDEEGVYHDYNFVEKRRSKLVTGASITPYVFGISEDKKGCLEAFKRLELPYGVAVGDKQTDSGFQWAYPNTWAPITYWVYQALTKVGADAEAQRVVRKYRALVERVFDQTGVLWEKYNALEGSIANSEYTAPPMMGWTAGVYRYFSEQEKGEKI